MLKLLLEWLPFKYDIVTLFDHNNIKNIKIKKNERKTRSESRDIDENDIG